MNWFCISCVIQSLVYIWHNVVRGEDTRLIIHGEPVDSPTDNFMIHCFTQAMPFACSMEFLRNNSTAENIRYSDGKCFDKFGKCKPGICACAENCKSFQWYLTTAEVQIHDSFGCQMRIYSSTNDLLFKVYTLADYNGKGFTSSTPIIYPAKKISETVPTPTGLFEKTKWAIISGTIYTMTALAFIIPCIICCCSRRRYNGKKKASEGDKGSQEGLDIPMKEIEM